MKKVYMIMMYNYPYSVWDSKAKAQEAAHWYAEQEEADDVDEVCEIVEMTLNSREDQVS